MDTDEHKQSHQVLYYSPCAVGPAGFGKALEPSVEATNVIAIIHYREEIYSNSSAKHYDVRKIGFRRNNFFKFLANP